MTVTCVIHMANSKLSGQTKLKSLKRTVKIFFAWLSDPRDVVMEAWKDKAR